MMDLTNLRISGDYRIRNTVKSIKAGANFRLFKRKNGELVLQKEYLEIIKDLDDGSTVIKPIWRDVETVCED